MNKSTPSPSSYVALCYHYVRSVDAEAHTPQLLGCTEEEFTDQISALKSTFRILKPEEVFNFHEGEPDAISGKDNLLLTFDDGLSDHYLVASILYKLGIRAFFFIPTCILDGYPANPIILHYMFSRYRIRGTLNYYHNAIKELGIEDSRYIIDIEERMLPWDAINLIKKTLNYIHGSQNTRLILLHMFENSLKKDEPEIFPQMHLTQVQLKEMKEMGHELGTHSHTHVSVGASILSSEQFKEEMILPKYKLETVVGPHVRSFSYPFGGAMDCLSNNQLLEQTTEYKIGFTVKRIANSINTSPLELGRHMPSSTDTIPDLIETIYSLQNYENPDLHK